MLKGLVLKESLSDTSVLNLLRITKTETWHVTNAASYQPTTWTAMSFEVKESQANTIAEKLSRALKPQWYINASTTSQVYVVFPCKVFMYPKGDCQQRAAAQQYGRSLGIPDSQLDWSE